MQFFVFRRMEGEELRQTLVTIGISIVLADLMLWSGAGNPTRSSPAIGCRGRSILPLVTTSTPRRRGHLLSYPSVRIAILVAAIVIGVAMWLVLNRTRARHADPRRRRRPRDAGRIRRAHPVVFLAVFAFGAGLAGMAGIVGGTFQSLSPGEDTRFLLASLVVVIVGGMGSIPGAAIGALIIGLAEQIGSVYAPTYSVVFTFLIMVAVLAFRPQGLLGARR